MLILNFLGTFQVQLDEKQITRFRSSNVQGMLVYLAMQADRSFPRDVIATLFWPDESTAVARTNLRQSLYQLRKVLKQSSDDPNPYLLITRQTVQFNPAADFRLDVDAFQNAIRNYKFEEAVDYYHGELLPGFSFGSLDFEDWLRPQREHLHHVALEALSDLADSYIAQAEYTQAQDYARRQLAFEPWRESAHRQLIRAFASLGEREAALAQYDRCIKVLDEEMGLEPGAETNELVGQITSGKFVVNTAAIATITEPPFQVPPIPDHFVGREAELEQISVGLTDQTSDGAAVVALVGMGGIGKSMLAAVTASQMRDQFEDGTLWANLLESRPEAILEQWGRAYGNDYSGIKDLDSRAAAVRGLLAPKATLLVIDNVIDAADARPLLQNGERCATIITTRSLDVAAALNATVIQLSELTIQNSYDLLVKVLGTERVEQSEDSRAAATQIGDLLHHLPLAVEITAQLLRSRSRLTLQGMAERLEVAKQRLKLEIGDKAVRASFTVSWEMLDKSEQKVFAALGVFGGRSFTMEPIQKILDLDQYDTEDHLYTLNALSLVKTEGKARFRQHPLLADFAAEKLVDKEAAFMGMSRFYLDFAKRHQADSPALEPEWENILAGVHTADAHHASELVLDYCDALERDWFNYGRYQDALQAYQLGEKAAEQLQEDEKLAALKVRQAEIGIEQGDYDASWNRLETALKIYYEHENDAGVADVQYFQGYVLFDQGEYAAAEKQVLSAIDLYKELDSPKLPDSIDLLAWIYFDYKEDLSMAETQARTALSLITDENSSKKLSPLRVLASIYYRKNNFDEALKFSRECLALSSNLGLIAEQATSIYYMVSIFSELGKYSLAQNTAENGLAIFRNIGNLRYESMILHEVSRINMKVGDLNQSLILNSETLKKYTRLKDRLGYGYALRHRGDILALLEKESDAREVWQEALNLANHIEHHHLKSQLESRLVQS